MTKSTLKESPFVGLDKYEVIYADPPWSYKNKSPTSAKRPSLYRSGRSQLGASYHYNEMSTNEICDLPISEIHGNKAVLFMWATTPLMPDAFKVMEAWGFTYKTMIVWHKLRSGAPGYWFRGVTEQLLVGVRGKVKAFRYNQHNIISHDVLGHSVKPEIFREIIESATDGMSGYIELFARRKSEGWESWGNEV